MPSRKKKPERRNSFALPTDGPLYDPMDDYTTMSPYTPLASDAGLGDEEGERNHRQQQIEMIESVLQFERLAWRAIRLIVASMLFFGLSAGVLGGVLGLALPDYLTAWFDASDRIDFKPWIVGLGHGLVWGLGIGAAIGCVVVLAVSLFQSRTLNNFKRDVAESPSES